MARCYDDEYALTKQSPGTTGRRHLQLSTPPKKKLFVAASFSGSIIKRPPSCAMASTCKTPGAITEQVRQIALVHAEICHSMLACVLSLQGGPAATALVDAATGREQRQRDSPGMIARWGKCPGKKLSLIVTFLYPTAYFSGSSSMTLSTRRKGNLQCKRFSN